MWTLLSKCWDPLGQVGSVTMNRHVTGQIIRIMEVHCGRGAGQYIHGQERSPSRTGQGFSEGTMAKTLTAFIDTVDEFLDNCVMANVVGEKNGEQSQILLYPKSVLGREVSTVWWKEL